MLDFKETADNFGQALETAATGILDKNPPKVQAVLDTSIKQTAMDGNLPVSASRHMSCPSMP